MYEPPAPDPRSQWSPAEPDGSPAAVWPPTQLWAGRARPDAGSAEEGGPAGRGHLSDQFRRRVEVAHSDDEPPQDAAPEGDDPWRHSNVVRLGGRAGGQRRAMLSREPERPTQHAGPDPMVPQIAPPPGGTSLGGPPVAAAPAIQGPGRADPGHAEQWPGRAQIGPGHAGPGPGRAEPGPVPATAAALGLGDDPTGEFPQWGTGLVPALGASPVEPRSGPPAEPWSAPPAGPPSGPPAQPSRLASPVEPQSAPPVEPSQVASPFDSRSAPPAEPVMAPPSGEPPRGVPEAGNGRQPGEVGLPGAPYHWSGPQDTAEPDRPPGAPAQPRDPGLDDPLTGPLPPESAGPPPGSQAFAGPPPAGSELEVAPRPRELPRRPVHGPSALVGHEAGAPEPPGVTGPGGDLLAGPAPSWLELLRLDAVREAEPAAPTAAPSAPTAVPRQPDARTGDLPPVEAAAPHGPPAPPARPEPAPAPEHRAESEPMAAPESGGAPDPADAWRPEAAPMEHRPPPADTVLTAVRELPGVRGAELVGEPGQPQVLRLDLVASVDPHTVGLQAADLLRDRLGVHAAVRARTQPESEPRRNRHREERDARTGDRPGVAVSVEQVQVVTAGLEAAVEVGLAVQGVRVAGRASGPAHDWHVLRAAVTATTEALGMLLAGRGRLALEYADLVVAGPSKVAVVSLLLLSGTGPERVAGAAPLAGEAPDAAVQATIAAIRHRLPELLGDA